MNFDTLNIEFYLNNTSLIALWTLSLWVYFKIDKGAGVVLFYSFFTDHFYKLILVYSDQISYSSEGMNAPIWIHVARLLSIIGHLLVPFGLWLLAKNRSRKV